MLFYTQLFTSKRGPLAKIWLAAHWERKITKTHVFECNLETTIKDIICPQIHIGLRTSGHLLLGVVRIYSRKAKYLLADCSDAAVKIKVAFRPGQTDLPEDGMEAMLKAITLPEDFADFDPQLPDPNAIDVVDHFSLNQCPAADITLREDFGKDYLHVDDFDERRSHQGGLFDMSFHSLGAHGDDFGDEGTGFDLLDFISNATDGVLPSELHVNSPAEIPPTPPPTAVNTADDTGPSSLEAHAEAPTLNETTLLGDEAEGFALEPVPETPSSERKRAKRKRKLVVDQAKELSNEAIRRQLSDSFDLLAPLDMAPPTRQLSEWKETGGVERLLHQLSTPMFHPKLQELFPRDLFPGRQGVGEVEEESDPEEMREQQHDADDVTSGLPLEELSQLQESVGPEVAAEAGSCLEPPLPHTVPPLHPHTATVDGTLETSPADLPSEDSMLVHPSGVERGTPLTPTPTLSVLDNKDVEERRMTSRAHHLLQALKKQSSSPGCTFSLQALCEHGSRAHGAALFFCLLVLRKQQALHLHQSAPYADILATPGPRFHQL